MRLSPSARPHHDCYETGRCTVTDDNYVSQAAWLRSAGREDAIDDVADQFERPTGADAFWASLDLRRTASIHAAAASFVPRVIERRAG